MGVSPVRAVVLGDLVTDVVLLPAREMRHGTDVSGRVVLRQGGSAAATARVLAGSGVATTLVTALGRDAAGDALAGYLEECGVSVCAVRVRARTGRLGVVVEASGERSFVADRGAILELRPHHLRREWFRGVSLLHLPAYSLLDDPLGEAGERAARLARGQHAAVSVDLSSAGFIEDSGAEQLLARIRRIAPAVLFANDLERSVVAAAIDRLSDLAPIVVLKQGASGATVLSASLGQPLEVRVRRTRVSDSTGAGDAFDAGFLAAWLCDPSPNRSALARAVRAGHAAARAEVTRRRVEFGLGLTRE